MPKPEPASERPSAVIAVTADNGDIYEATRASKNEAWTITIPKGRIGLPERRLSFARILSG